MNKIKDTSKGFIENKAVCKATMNNLRFLLLAAFMLAVSSAYPQNIDSAYYSDYPTIGEFHEMARIPGYVPSRLQGKWDASGDAAADMDAVVTASSGRYIRFTLSDDAVSALLAGYEETGTFPDSLYEDCCESLAAFGIAKGSDESCDDNEYSCIRDYPPFCYKKLLTTGLDYKVLNKSLYDDIDIDNDLSHFYYSKAINSHYACNDYTVDKKDIDWDFLYELGYLESRGEKVIALIDTGYDPHYPSLKRGQALWINEDEIYGNGLDDDGNGYVDDRYGYDFLSNTGDTTSIWNDSNSSHGTLMATLMGAAIHTQAEKDSMRYHHGIYPSGRAQNYVSFQGSDPGARIMNLRGETADAIRYAADNGASIINMSWGGDGYRIPRDWDLELYQEGSHVFDIFEALEYAWSKGCLLVASGGNGGSDLQLDPMSIYQNQYHYPSGHPAVISVGPLVDRLYSFRLTIGTPGKKSDLVMTDWLTHSVGTSNSAAFVSGMASLLWSYYPNLTNVEMKERLLETAKDTLFDYRDSNEDLYAWNRDIVGYRVIDPPRYQRVFDNSLLVHDELGWDEYYGYGMPNYKDFIEGNRFRDVHVDPLTGSVDGYEIYLSRDPADFSAEQQAAYALYLEETALSSSVLEERRAIAYPNPIGDYVYFDRSVWDLSYRLCNVSGHLISSGTATSEGLSSVGWPEGLYVLSFAREGLSTKLLKH